METIKTRKQGNKIMVTVPKSFNVDAGVKLRPRLTSKGIFYEFVDGNAFLDFDEEILNDLVTHEYDGQELVKKFKSIKCYLPLAMDKLITDAKDETKDYAVMSRKKLEKEVGL